MTAFIGRREFIALLGGAAAAWPNAAHAQQPSARVRRIAAFTSLAPDDAEMMRRNAAFEQTLQELGWKVGHNITIEYRYGAGDHERMRKHAAELAALAPDVIFVVGGATEYMLRATRTVPIVFAGIADAIGGGFAESLTRPGRNMTGFTTFEYGLSGKWLELLKELAPAVTREEVLRDPISASGGRAIRRIAGGRAVHGGRGDPNWIRRRCRDRAQCHENSRASRMPA